MWRFLEAMAPFIPSEYQENIFSFYRSGKGNGIIDAVAGSGKTTTLIEVAKMIPVSQDAMFLAFNKHIAENLKTKIQRKNVFIATLHSVGYSMLAKSLHGRLNVQTSKYRDIAKSLIEQEFRDTEKSVTKRYADQIGELVRFCQVTLTNPLDNVSYIEMINHFQIDIHSKLEHQSAKFVHQILTIGEDQARLRIIDYNDMLWLPCTWNLYPQQVDNLFVDEAQDLSAAGLDIAMRCLKDGGRSLFIGDPRQSIMGFAGADDQSFWKIKERTNATLLPLSVCYRCPRSHIELAQQIVPQIEARNDAPDGIIEYVDDMNIGTVVHVGDMIICRVTAPLISLCIQLIEQRIPAHVKGRDIGKQIVDIISVVQRYDEYSWDRFGEYLDIHETQTIAKLSQRKNAESMIVAITDKISALRVCYETFHCISEKNLADEINKLFSDDVDGVTLSTVHKSKGMEAQNVFLLLPEKMPLVWPNQLDWEFTQEMNIRYVALTRATAYLGFITDHATGKKNQSKKVEEIKNVLDDLHKTEPKLTLFPSLDTTTRKEKCDRSKTVSPSTKTSEPVVVRKNLSDLANR